VRAISPALAAAPIRARQACFRPITEDGLPLLGPVPGVAGAYVATGHNVWGMLNAPATGEAMAELILDGAAPPRRSGAVRAATAAHVHALNRKKTMEFDVMTRATTWDNVANLAAASRRRVFPACCSPKATRCPG